MSATAMSTTAIPTARLTPNYELLAGASSFRSVQFLDPNSPTSVRVTSSALAERGWEGGDGHWCFARQLRRISLALVKALSFGLPCSAVAEPTAPVGDLLDPNG
jgi:hypothetical protein